MYIWVFCACVRVYVCVIILWFKDLKCKKIKLKLHCSFYLFIHIYLLVFYFYYQYYCLSFAFLPSSVSVLDGLCFVIVAILHTFYCYVSSYVMECVRSSLMVLCCYLSSAQAGPWGGGMASVAHLITGHGQTELKRIW